ncbi:PEP/pyruvate-binding domain-containing protein [Paenibacillus amylolyticus]|nr:PEP/pyruvate-binding domain-containing protein [Paenibacillus amylolyticus]
MTKRVVLLEEGTAEMKGLMGSKGAGLAVLLQAGWPVPAGFIVTREGCRVLYPSWTSFHRRSSRDWQRSSALGRENRQILRRCFSTVTTCREVK